MKNSEFLARTQETLREHEQDIATARAAARNAALEEAAKALRLLDIHHHHVGYDDGPGGGNYVYAEVVILAEAEAAIRALIGTDPTTDRGEG